ncbi:MAG TPA: type II secretion system secretin GspD [Caulobacteraceae bacterium]|nr:type II secretion system secretin GspD [Caulobacteraceae bacterium]
MKRLAVYAVLAALAVTPAGPALAQAQVLNVQDADIRAFIQDVGRTTGTTFVIDPRVKGTVSVASQGALNRSELFEVFLATLRANGFVAIPTGARAYRIEPAEGAARQASTAGGQFVTQVFRLRTADAVAVAEMLKPLVGAQGQVIANAQGNTVVVADYADNVRRIRGLITQIDQDQASVQTVTLRNSSAREIALVLQALNSPVGADGKPGRGPVTVAPVEGSNSIVLRGDPDAIQRLLPIIADLDRRAETSDDVRVVYLRHANAEQMLPVLQQLVGQAPTAPAGQGGETQPAVVSTGQAKANIARYPGANALIISANPDTQRMLGEVITQLDVRREQVLVEAIVVEVSDEAARELGLQLLVGGGPGQNAPFAATSYSNSGPNLLAIAGALAGEKNLPEDSTALEALRNTAISSIVGAAGTIGGFGGRLDGGALFGAIINAVKRDSGSHLLSTPSILTLDNEEATILVGQEVPITTGEVLGDANSNPFRTVQRQNVGIQLEVKPQINAGGGITLFLRQEVSSVAGTVSSRSDELILNKREIETTALVDDGEIVVLGGLLDQTEESSIERTPLLGDIPGIGELFKSRARKGGRRNLMVFIRPRIIRNPRDARAISADRYDYLRAEPALTGRSGSNTLDTLVRDYLAATAPAAEARP